MHAAVQPDGYSPKSVDSSASAQQFKSGSESAENSGNSSHSKGKKRLRNDQSMELTKGDQVTETTLKRDRGTESAKREHSTKPDDGGAITFKFDKFNAEITKITEKGGLVSIEEVENLLNLMHLDISEKKMDMAGRMMLAGIIAATERHDCLLKFVQLRGVPVLDEWLQEVHKGKTENGSNPRESDKLVEEFILSLLKALEKLPIFLNTLQTSNIGKSVNYLRSHKNLEVQKKARVLVDTWKKRVDAEMSKINEGKSFGSSQSVSCTVKPGYPDVSHAGNKRGGSTEPVAKMSAGPITCKALPGKPGVLDSNKKSNLSAPVAVSLKDSHCKITASNGCSELLPATINEDSASCQSRNNNQCPSDQAQLIASSLKEEARSPAAGSDNTCKQVGSPSRYRKPNNGLLVTDVPETDKETYSGGGSDSVNKVLTAEKTSQSALACDKPLDMAVVDHGNSNRLTVRLSNPIRSPGKSDSGGHFEDPLVMDNRPFSPAVTDKQDHSDNKTKSTSDVPWGNVAPDANAELRKGNDVEESMVGTEIVRSSVALDGELRRNIEEVGKVTHPSNTALAVGDDDTGMNLPATVAAGEISMSTDLVGTSPSQEDVCSGTSEQKSRLSCEDDIIQMNVQHDEPANVDSEKQGKIVDCISANHTSQLGKTNFSICAIQLQQLQYDESIVHQTTQPIISCMNSLEMVDTSMKVEVKLEEERIDEAACKPAKEELYGDGVASLKEKQVTDGQLLDVNTCDVAVSGRKLEIPLSEEPMLSTVAKELLIGDSPTDQQTRDAVDERTVTVVSLPADSVPSPKATDDSITPKSDNLGVNHIELTHEGKERKNASPSRSDELVRSAAVSLVPAEIVGDLKMSHETCSVEPATHEGPSSFTIKETENPTKSKTSGFPADASDRLASPAEHCLSIIPAKKDVSTKLELDLNEGISGDDGNQSQLVVSAASLCSSAVHLPELSPFPNLKLNDLPSTITVASPAKRPFLPPEILSMTKSEPGWKGSAVTSAFRPAEPRKIMEMSSNNLDILPSHSAGKQSRPLVDIDLNVADEEVLDDMTFQSTTRMMGITCSLESPARAAGGVDLDLNRVDDGMENGQYMESTSCRMEMALLSMQPASAEFSGRGANVLRNFDLNDRPNSDEVCLKTGARNQLANYLSNTPNLAPVADYRAYYSEAGHVSPWYHSNHYPVIAPPSLLFERGEQSNTAVAVAGSQKILGPVTGGGILGSDIYRGSALSASPAMVVSQTTALSYPNFPFPSKFPIASTSLSDGSTTFLDPSSGSGSCFPLPSLLVGPAGSVSSHYQRPYTISFPESSTSGASDNTLKWSRQGFDLNTGPRSGDLEEKDEKLSSASRQLLLPTSHAFMDNQARMYRPPVLGSKRKEPEWSQDAGRPAKKLAWKQGDY